MKQQQQQRDAQLSMFDQYNGSEYRPNEILVPVGNDEQQPPAPKTLIRWFTQFGDSKEHIEERIKLIDQKVRASGGKFFFKEPYVLRWEDGDQWRVRCSVIKYGERTTWDEIYKAINSVNAVKYCKTQREGWL